jgi:sugar phosphate permease
MPKVPFYYGWVILLALAVTEMLAMGTTSYAAGLFVLPLETEFGLTRAAANSALSLLLIGVTVFAPFVGLFLDRHSVKWILSIGALGFGLAFAVIATTSSLLLMAGMLILPASIGYLAIGTLTTGTLLSRWFCKRRGLALGLGAVATSGGGIFIVPIIVQLIADYGWRTTLLIEAGAIALITILLAIFVVHNNPTDMGLENHPENVSRSHTDQSALQVKAPPRWSWQKILSSKSFWGTALTLGIVAGICQALVTTLPPYSVQLGFRSGVANLIMYFAIAAGTTKILGGLLADHINRRFILFCGGMIIALAAIVLFLWSSFAAIAAATILAGIGLGLTLPASSAQIAVSFGPQSFGAVMGLAYAFFGILTILLPPIAGAIYDRTGSYDVAFLFFVVLATFGAVMTWLIPGGDEPLTSHPVGGP